jgi:hypothetical protein
MMGRTTCTLATTGLVLGALAAGPATAAGPVDDGGSGDTRVTVTVTVGDLRAEVPELADEESCWYRSGLVLGPADVEFDNPELRPLTAGEVAGLGYDRSVPEVSALLEEVSVYAIPKDLDPLQAAMNMGSGAAPVLMAGYAGHWGYAPGDTPIDEVSDGPVPIPPASLFTGVREESQLIGVVDTGFIDFPITPWPDGRIVAASARDHEPASTRADLAGHGMFVASTILQRNPETTMIVARAGVTPLAEFRPAPGWARARFWYEHVHQTDGSATDELQMFFAVQRLLDSNVSSGTTSNTTFAGLNISMGAYQCDQLSHSGLAIRAAMAHWLDGQPDAPVVAAAGNHLPHEPPPGLDFLPADLDLSPASVELLPVVSGEDLDLTGLELTAVAALDREGRTLAAYSNFRPYDLLAIGTDVLAVRDGVSVTSWSGSSFATAVVTGAVTAGEKPVDRVYDLAPVRQRP